MSDTTDPQEAPRSGLFASMVATMDENAEPKPDLAKCSQCGWKGPVGECGTDSEGDWESGYYDIHTCPKCDDGGCVDGYDMTPDQEAKWWAWHSRMNASPLATPPLTPQDDAQR